jgi:hypothetical protein
MIYQLYHRWDFLKGEFAVASSDTATPIRPMFHRSYVGTGVRVAETRAVNRALRKAYSSLCPASASKGIA